MSVGSCPALWRALPQMPLLLHPPCRGNGLAGCWRPFKPRPGQRPNCSAEPQQTQAARLPFPGSLHRPMWFPTALGPPSSFLPGQPFCLLLPFAFSLVSKRCLVSNCFYNAMVNKKPEIWSQADRGVNISFTPYCKAG